MSYAIEEDNNEELDSESRRGEKNHYLSLLKEAINYQIR